jgi:hypothetical protein
MAAWAPPPFDADVTGAPAAIVTIVTDGDITGNGTNATTDFTGTSVITVHVVKSETNRLTKEIEEFEKELVAIQKAALQHEHQLYLSASLGESPLLPRRSPQVRGSLLLSKLRRWRTRALPKDP